MKIILIVVGKTTDSNVAEGIREYALRVSRFTPFEIKVIPDLRNAGRYSPQKQKEEEGKLLLEQMQGADHVVLLDEHGKEMTSREFAAFVSRKSVELPRNLIFVVGGPYGFSNDVYARANGMLSLSKMTFPHELVRLFFTEQLYRAMTIIRNMPYHHD